jgi:hypothetical protein
MRAGTDGRTKNATNALKLTRTITGTFPPENRGKKAKIAPNRAKTKNHVATSNMRQKAPENTRPRLFSNRPANPARLSSFAKRSNGPP